MKIHPQNIGSNHLKLGALKELNLYFVDGCLTLYLLNQGLPKELTEIEPNFGFKPIKTKENRRGATAEPSIAKPENRWNETLLWELFSTVPKIQENHGLSYSNSSKFDSWAPSHVIWN